MSTLSHNSLNSSPIGFFDSGVGGLSVYSRFKMILPFENTLYYGDLAHLPYGNKSQKELIGYAREILNFFKSRGVKAVVIACNTSSAQAYDVIKDEYDFKIYPIIQSCAKVIAGMDIKSVGVFATEATIQAHAYKRELNKYNNSLKVNEIACPNWVTIVENGAFNEAYTDVKNYMVQMLSTDVEKIILGCTHYPYLMSVLTKFASKDMFIDPAEIFADYIKNDLESLNLLNSQIIQGTEEFFVSARPDDFIKNSALFYKINTEPQIPLCC